MADADDAERRIADLERQLAEAEAAAGDDRDAEQPIDPRSPLFDDGPVRDAIMRAAAGAGVSQDQLDDALQRAQVSVTNGPARGFAWPGLTGLSTTSSRVAWRAPRRPRMSGANLVGAVIGALGGCAGGAAALTAVLPSSALWTSRLVCGGPDLLMVNTSHYSYKPGQSGTNIDFQCLGAGGAHDASFLAITALQTALVALLVCGATAAVLLLRSVAGKRKLQAPYAIGAGVVALCGLAVAVTFVWQNFTTSPRPIQLSQGGSLTVHGNGDTQTIACNDGHLTITGRDETVNITGHCSRISVDGVIHHVTVDSVDAVDVDGLDNVITYHSGAPLVTNSGFRNSVQHG